MSLRREEGNFMLDVWIPPASMARKLVFSPVNIARRSSRAKGISPVLGEHVETAEGSRDAEDMDNEDEDEEIEVE